MSYAHLLDHFDEPTFVRIRNNGFEIYGEPGVQQELRGQFTGEPEVIHKKFADGKLVNESDSKFPGSRAFLRVRLETEEHGTLTIELPPKSARAFCEFDAGDGDIALTVAGDGKYFSVAFGRVEG